MARIRSVKPEFWVDRRLSRLSRDARLLYIALWNQSDEHGRMQGDVRYVKGHCLPYDDDLSLDDVNRLLGELIKASRVRRYVVDGDPFLLIVNLHKHQRLEPHKAASRLPPPPDGDDDPDPGYVRDDLPGEPARSPADLAGASETPQTASAATSAPSLPFGTTRRRSGATSPVCADFPGEARPIVVQQVAGSMEHGAGSMGSSVAPAEHKSSDLAPANPHAPPAAENAQTLVAEWIDHCNARPPKRIIGQVAKLIGQMLAEGITYDHLRRGLASWASKGLNPATLPSEVNAVMNARPLELVKPARVRASTTDAKVSQTLALARQLREQQDQLFLPASGDNQ